MCHITLLCLTLVCLCVAEFSIWTREAGAGGLSIAVEGPSKAEIAFEDRKDGSSGVSYIVQEPGEYETFRVRMLQNINIKISKLLVSGLICFYLPFLMCSITVLISIQTGCQILEDLRFLSLYFYF